MSIYTSQGTIRIRCDTNSITTLYFVPESDYSIKYRNDRYAVFVPQSCDCKTQSWKNALIRKYDPDKGNGVEIHCDPGKGNGVKTDCMYVISSSAMHQNKVVVEVEMKTKLEKMAEMAEMAKSKIPEVVEKVVKEIANNNKEDAKKKAAEQVMNEELQKLVDVANESEQRFDLIGITIPAQ